MVDIAPFHATRYVADKKKKEISRFICPPYDVISPAEREQLGVRSSQNVVHLELPTGDDLTKYQNASKLLNEWKDDGRLKQDEEASFYLLETVYKIADPFAPNKQLKRYGVLTALKLETPGKGAVHPHEKTLPKAKEDRLNLITALQTNVSPIFGLFFDPKRQWSSWVKKVIKRKPDVIGEEKSALTHRMWRIDSPALQKSLRNLLKSKHLYIADGHHRYEVSWAYQEGRLKNCPTADLRCGWRRVMAYVCPMEEPGLLMLPTHRLVKTKFTVQDWRKHLEQTFDITPVKNADQLIKGLIKPSGKPSGRRIGWVNAEGMYFLQLKKNVSIDRCLAHRPKALRELDVVLLHDVILCETAESSRLKDREIIFTRNMKEVVGTPQKDSSWVSFVLSSPGVGSLARVAGANEVMPPKTTYFYPKVPTGFALMGLEQKIG